MTSYKHEVFILQGNVIAKFVCSMIYFLKHEKVNTNMNLNVARFVQTRILLYYWTYKIP